MVPQPVMLFSFGGPAHTPWDVCTWRVSQNSGVVEVDDAQPAPFVAVETSAAFSHTCHPEAHRSSTEQPRPAWLELSLPAWRPHCGEREPVVVTPATWKPPSQPAMFGRCIKLS